MYIVHRKLTVHDHGYLPIFSINVNVVFIFEAKTDIMYLLFSITLTARMFLKTSLFCVLIGS